MNTDTVRKASEPIGMSSTIFVAYAHPKRESFAGDVLNRFQNRLESAGHTVDLSDLYAKKFEPTFSAEEFDCFRGSGNGRYEEDITDIPRRISAAYGLALVFPVWWWSAPAILKGWFDHVLNNDFAYRFDGHKIIPIMADKSVVMICLGGSSTKTCQKYGYAGVIQRQIEAGNWFYCGSDNVQTHLMADAEASPEQRKAHLADAERIGRMIARPGTP